MLKPYSLVCHITVMLFCHFHSTSGSHRRCQRALRGCVASHSVVSAPTESFGAIPVGSHQKKAYIEGLEQYYAMISRLFAYYSSIELYRSKQRNCYCQSWQVKGLPLKSLQWLKAQYKGNFIKMLWYYRMHKWIMYLFNIRDSWIYSYRASLEIGINGNIIHNSSNMITCLDQSIRKKVS